MNALLKIISNMIFLMKKKFFTIKYIKMKKTKNDQARKKTLDMIGLEMGGMENLKTHEDFNNQHPNELDKTILTKGNSDEDKKKSTKKLNLKNK